MLAKDWISVQKKDKLMVGFNEKRLTKYLIIAMKLIKWEIEEEKILKIISQKSDVNIQSIAVYCKVFQIVPIKKIILPRQKKVF